MPQGPKPGESKNDFIGRCVPVFVEEGKGQKQAVAICYSMWERNLEEEYIKKTKTDEASLTYNYPDTGGIAGDDDFPTGNILMGDKFVKKPYYNRLTSFNINWDIDTKDWTWDEFDACAGQGSKDSYSDTLKNSVLSNRLFKHMHIGKPKPVPKSQRALGNDLGPFTDAWGNKEKYAPTADFGPINSEENPDMKKGVTEMDVIKRIDVFLIDEAKETSVTAKNLKKGMNIWRFGKVDDVSKQGHIIIVYSGKNRKKYDENESVTILNEATMIPPGLGSKYTSFKDDDEWVIVKNRKVMKHMGKGKKAPKIPNDFPMSSKDNVEVMRISHAKKMGIYK